MPMFRRCASLVVARVFRPLAISDTALNAMSTDCFGNLRISASPTIWRTSVLSAEARTSRLNSVGFILRLRSIPGTITSARQAESPVIVVSSSSSSPSPVGLSSGLLSLSPVAFPSSLASRAFSNVLRSSSLSPVGPPPISGALSGSGCCGDRLMLRLTPCGKSPSSPVTDAGADSTSSFMVSASPVLMAARMRFHQFFF
ncbi:Uncharacterised protein [Salmonella enterica subsp. enterica serovar Typhi]|nr:Uncharacterised protein [Salmonella enterica subsp. enterica serovar Typhi]